MGYVGLPLAVEFGKIINTTGFDINKSRIRELISGNDLTLEIKSNELKEATIEPIEFAEDISIPELPNLPDVPLTEEDK